MEGPGKAEWLALGSQFVSLSLEVVACSFHVAEAAGIGLSQLLTWCIGYELAKYSKRYTKAFVLPAGTFCRPDNHKPGPINKEEALRVAQCCADMLRFMQYPMVLRFVSIYQGQAAEAVDTWLNSSPQIADAWRSRQSAISAKERAMVAFLCCMKQHGMPRDVRRYVVHQFGLNTRLAWRSWVI